ncbi:MAG TPA: DUF5777 family beta-barrel protein [Draconibacterium sp.]|nr:DUF5777 family beta-barrel protein [Draconibacterium sp.]
MKKIILILLILGISTPALFAQEEDVKVSPFESGTMIDAQTTYIPDAKTLEFVIQHNFGSVDNGKSDLWGIYAPAQDIRLSLNYVAAKNFQIGAGISRTNMYSDFNAKWTVLQQSTKKMPVSVSLFGSLAIDGRNASSIAETGKIVDTKGETLPSSIGFGDRFSYFSELMVSRKFCEEFSLQAGVSFTHYNTVGWDYNHDVVGLHVNGKIKFSPQGSFIFTYDKPLKFDGMNEQTNWDSAARENVAVGVQFFTFTHAFQIYLTSANAILPQHVMMYNQNDWTKSKGIALGFTITRLWMF